MSLKGKCRKNGTVSAAAVKGKEITEINRAPSQPKTDFFSRKNSIRILGGGKDFVHRKNVT